MTAGAFVGLDQDGALLFCASMVEGAWEESVSTHAVVEIEGVNPPGALVFETARRRFRMREEDTLKRLAASVIDDPVAYRVRTMQALLDRQSAFGNQPLKMALGLPVDRFFLDLAAGTPDVEFQRQWLAEQEIAVTREPVPATVNVVVRNVASRGIAAYFDWTRDEEGQPGRHHAAGVVTVLDVGVRDTAVLTFDKQDRLQTDQSRVLPCGYLTLLEALDQALQREHGVSSVRSRVLLSILLAGQYHLQRQPHDASALLRAGSEALAGHLLSVMKTMDVHAHDVVVAGPAALPIAAALRVGQVRAHAPDRPAFANARGMAKFVRAAG